MTTDVEKIANALLYEGYNLYPYRPTAIKNQHRWLFGVLYPKTYCARQTSADAWRTQTECLVTGNAGITVGVKVRFLQLLDHKEQGQAWKDAVDRSVKVNVQLDERLAAQEAFSFSASAGDRHGVEGLLKCAARRCHGKTFKLSVTVENRVHLAAGDCDDRHQALLRSLISTHTLLSADHGAFGA